MRFSTIFVSTLAAAATASPVDNATINKRAVIAATALDYFCTAPNLMVICNTFGQASISLVTASFPAECQTFYAKYYKAICTTAQGGLGAEGCSELKDSFFQLSAKKCLPSYLQPSVPSA